MSSQQDLLRVINDLQRRIGELERRESGGGVMLTGNQTVAGNKTFTDTTFFASFVRWTLSGVNKALVGVATGANSLINGTAAGDLAICTTSGQKMLFSTDDGTTAALIIRGGFLALPERSASIASGAITATGSFMVVDTEGNASTDDLTTINPGLAPDGAFITLRSNNGSRDVTIKSGTGNIRTNGGADRDLGSTRERWVGQYYSAANIWVEVSYSDNPA